MIYCIKYIAERKKGHETEFERILVIMKKKQSLIIIIESVLVVWLAVFMLAELEHRQDRKEVFVNKVYFLLTDISNDFIILEYGEDITFDVYRNLVTLDTVCQTYAQETKGKFYYPEPTVFGKIASNLHNNVYDENELKMLISDIQIIIQHLSDSTGKAENAELSYEELNTVFQSFYESWQM